MLIQISNWELQIGAKFEYDQSLTWLVVTTVSVMVQHTLTTSPGHFKCVSKAIRIWHLLSLAKYIDYQTLMQIYLRTASFPMRLALDIEP